MIQCITLLNKLKDDWLILITCATLACAKVPNTPQSATKTPHYATHARVVDPYVHRYTLFI